MNNETKQLAQTIYETTNTLHDFQTGESLPEKALDSCTASQSFIVEARMH